MRKCTCRGGKTWNRHDCELFCFCGDRYNFNMDSRLSFPLITSFTRYSEWKLKMFSSLKRQGLYGVSIGLGKESYEYKNNWLNDGDRDFGTICLEFSPVLHYLIDFVEYPKDLWT